MVDDIEVSLNTCHKPTGVHLASYAGGTAVIEWDSVDMATISWTAGGNETQWELTFTEGRSDSFTVGSTHETITGLAQGTAYAVKVRALCGSDDHSEYTDPVGFITLYNEDIESAYGTGLTVCPNPAADRLTVSGMDAGADVEFVDISGRVAGTWTAAGGELDIDVGSMPRGVYFMRVTADGYSVATRIVLQ